MAAVEKYPKYVKGIAVHSENEKNSYCYICPGKLTISSDEHLKDVEHLSIFNYYIHNFTDSGPFARCKLCLKWLEYNAILQHAVSHKLIPWYRCNEKFKIFFANFISSHNNEHYCHLCCVKLSWYNAISHTEETNHQALRRDKINEAAIKELSFSKNYYKRAIDHAIFMQTPEGSRCALCCVEIGVSLLQIHNHTEDITHVMNVKKFIETLEEKLIHVPPVVGNFDFDYYSSEADKTPEINQFYLDNKLDEGMVQLSLSFCTICHVVIDSEGIEAHLDRHNKTENSNCDASGDTMNSFRDVRKRESIFQEITFPINEKIKARRISSARNEAEGTEGANRHRCTCSIKLCRYEALPNHERIFIKSDEFRVRRISRQIKTNFEIKSSAGDLPRTSDDGGTRVQKEAGSEDLPTEVRHISDTVYECTLCPCQINGKVNIKGHINAAFHQRELSLRDKNDGPIPIEIVDNTAPINETLSINPTTSQILPPDIVMTEVEKFFWCETCSVKISGYKNVFQHLKALKHSTNKLGSLISTLNIDSDFSNGTSNKNPVKDIVSSKVSKEALKKTNEKSSPIVSRFIDSEKSNHASTSSSSISQRNCSPTQGMNVADQSENPTKKRRHRGGKSKRAKEKDEAVHTNNIVTIQCNELAEKEKSPVNKEIKTCQIYTESHESPGKENCFRYDVCNTKLRGCKELLDHMNTKKCKPLEGEAAEKSEKYKIITGMFEKKQIIRFVEKEEVEAIDVPEVMIRITRKSYYCLLCKCDVVGHKAIFEHAKAEGNKRTNDCASNDRGLGLNGNSADVQELPPHIVATNETGKYWCEVCSIPLYTYKVVFEHYNGSKHSKKMNLLNSTSSDTSRCDSKNMAATEVKLSENFTFNQSLFPGITVITEGKDQFWCEVCSVKISGPKTVSQHVNAPKHMEKMNSSNLISEDNCSSKGSNKKDDESIPIISNRMNSTTNNYLSLSSSGKYALRNDKISLNLITGNDNKKLNNNKELTRDSVRLIYSPGDKVFLTECRICEQVIVGDSSSVTEHVKSEKHEDTRIFISYLRGSDVALEMQPKLDEHDAIEYFIAEDQVEGDDNLINVVEVPKGEAKDSGKFFTWCKTCCIKIEDGFHLNEHLKSDFHLDNFEEKLISSKSGKENHQINHSDSKSTENNQKRRNYPEGIKEIQGEDYFLCTLCNGQKLFDENSVFEHVHSLIHLNNQQKLLESEEAEEDKVFFNEFNSETEAKSEAEDLPPGVEKIYVKSWYLCRLCDRAIISSPCIIDHVNRKIHSRKLEEIKGTTNFEKIHSLRDLPEEVKKMNGKDFFLCTICNVSITLRECIDEHVGSLRHKNNGEKIIFRTDDKLFECKICSVKMSECLEIIEHLSSKGHRAGMKQFKKTKKNSSLNVFDEHLQENTVELQERDLPVASKVHKMSAENSTSQIQENPPDGIEDFYVKSYYLCKLCDVEVFSRSEINEHTNGEHHLRQLIKTNSITECETIISRRESLKYVEKLGGKHLFSCTICNKRISGPGEFEEHVNSSPHKDNGKKVIFRISGEIFECKICNQTLNGYLRVRMHLRMGRHRKAQSNSEQLKKEGSRNLVDTSFEGENDEVSSEASIEGRGATAKSLSPNFQGKNAEDQTSENDFFSCSSNSEEIDQMKFTSHACGEKHRSALMAEENTSAETLKLVDESTPVQASVSNSQLQDEEEDSLMNDNMSSSSEQSETFNSGYSDTEEAHVIASIVQSYFHSNENEEISDEMPEGISEIEGTDYFVCMLCDNHEPFEKSTLIRHVNSENHQRIMNHSENLKSETKVPFSSSSSSSYEQRGGSDLFEDTEFVDDDVESVDELCVNQPSVSTPQLPENIYEPEKQMAKPLEDAYNIEGTNIWCCVGCDRNKLFTRSGLISHLQTKKHTKSKRKLRLEAPKPLNNTSFVISQELLSEEIVGVPTKSFAVCKLCECKVSNESFAYEHVSNEDHRARKNSTINKNNGGKLASIETFSLQRYLPDGIEKFSNQVFFLCTICNIKLPGLFDIEQHIQSQTHKLKGKKVIFKVREDEFQCQRCCTLMSGYSALVNHLSCSDHSGEPRPKIHENQELFDGNIQIQQLNNESHQKRMDHSEDLYPKKTAAPFDMGSSTSSTNGQRDADSEDEDAEFAEETRINVPSVPTSQLNQNSGKHEEPLGEMYNIPGTSIWCCLGCNTIRIFNECGIMGHVTGKQHLKTKMRLSLKPPKPLNNTKSFISPKFQSEGIVGVPTKRFAVCTLCECRLSSEVKVIAHISNGSHQGRKKNRLINGISSLDYQKMEDKDVESIDENVPHADNLPSNPTAVPNSKLDQNLRKYEGQSRQSLPEIYNIQGTNAWCCLGCNTTRIFTQNDINEHVMGEQHSKSKMRRLSKAPKPLNNTKVVLSPKLQSEGIVIVPTKTFVACTFCECKLPSQSHVNAHIIDENHRARKNNRAIIKNQDRKLEPTATLSSSRNLPDGIEKFTDRDFFLCTICRVKLLKQSDVEEHIRSSSHKLKGKKVIFKIEEDKFRCSRCLDRTIVLSGYSALVNHLNSSEHSKQVENKQIENKIPYLRAFFKKLMKNPKKTLDNLDSDKGIMNDIKILPDGILRIEEIRANWCIKCNISVSEGNLQSHRYGSRHRKALETNKTAQDIQTFYCELCDRNVIGKGSWISHESSAKHKKNERALLGASSTEISDQASVESPRKIQPMISNFQLSEDDNLREESGTSDSSKPENTIIYRKYQPMVDCNICRCKIPGGDINISNHRNSKEHKDNEAKLFGRPNTPVNNALSVSNKCTNAGSFNAIVPLDAYCKYHYRDDNMIDFIECNACKLKVYGTESISANFVYADHMNSEGHRMKEIEFVKKWRPSPVPSTSRSESSIKSSSKSSAKSATKKTRERRSGLLRLFKKLDKNRIVCSMCHTGFKDKQSLHSHMTKHFWQRFTKNPAPITEEAQQVPAKSESLELTGDSDDESVLNDSPKKIIQPSPRTSRFRRKPLDVEVSDSLDIYEIDKQKMNEVKAGVLLSLPKDNYTTYCLICRRDVNNNSQTFYEHLCSVKHLDYLKGMLEDDKLFQDYENQFSDLALGYEYMEDISKYAVKCHACKISVSNHFPQLNNHINSASHIDKWTALDENSRELFKELKSKMKCNFYSVRKYWCVICSVNFITEYEFQKHLKQRKHLNKIQRFNDEFLMFDYCGVCASLWYGFLKTFSYHSECNMHKYHKLDGFFSISKLPESAERLLNSAKERIEAILKDLEFRRSIDRIKEAQLLHDLKEIAVEYYPNAVAHPFGSRITGLGGINSDLDVFLDCPTKNNSMYFGTNSHPKLIERRLEKIKECLENNTNIWHIEREILDCRIPIIKTKHKPTDIDCDLSFTNGLTVENTSLIRNYCDKSSDCRKLIIFIKNWMNHCELGGANGINSYGIAWLVIYFLQTKKILPTVNQLIEMKNQSQLIAGWETGVSHDFQVQTLGESFGELLKQFFKFYGNFDYRNDVICPLLGEIVKKIDFQHRGKLPSTMWSYSNYLYDSADAEPFRVDSIMCLQDPFDLAHNITKAVKKFKIYQFKTFCCYSAQILGYNP